MSDSDRPGYRDIPEADRRKAKSFFDRGATVAGTGQYDYAIEMYLSGLNIDPEATDAHQSLRDISLRRKASGGKAIGMWDKMKIKTNTKDNTQNMLAAEKLLAFDPGNTDYMLTMMQNAYSAGFWDTAMWIGPILYRANSDTPKPDFAKFIALRDVYVRLERWQEATEACQAAVLMKPDDMDLNTELKNLGAQHTMSVGKYGRGGSFRDSIRDMDGQKRLMDQDTDVRTLDAMTRMILEAEQEWRAAPEEPGKISKLVDLLVKSEDPKNESRAVDLLTSAFERSKQFRYRLGVGRIKLLQLKRKDRALREGVLRDPQDEVAREEYRQFIVDRAEEELREFSLFAENYPTDLSYKNEMAKRLVLLQRFDEAIPLYQTARQDPKIRIDATINLGQSFLSAGYTDEAVDTLRGVIEEYQLKGDDKSKEMYYWYARALEAQNDTATAIKSYSQVAQWDFNYRDVQSRIKRLRAGGQNGAAEAG